MPGAKYDRSSEIMPTMGGDPLMRLTTAPPATPRYNKGFTRPIPEDAKGLQELSPSVQRNMGYTEDEEGRPLKRHMKFCGGGSKPYKKK